MPVPSESIEVGKCYLARAEVQAGGNAARVRRVTRIYHDGRVQYELRRGPIEPGHARPRQGTTSITSFAHQAEREVSCGWTPEEDG